MQQLVARFTGVLERMVGAISGGAAPALLVEEREERQEI